MKVAVYSCHPFESEPLRTCNARHGHELHLLAPSLNLQTACLAADCPVVSAFVSDQLDAPVLQLLFHGGTRMLALRSAGFNHVDLAAAARLGLVVARVPAYSPYSVAEHAVGLMLSLNRKIHRAYVRTREHNFALEGLLGFDMHGKTVGVVGTGRIGSVVAQIMLGFGCRVLAFDPVVNAELKQRGVDYVPLPVLLCRSDVVTLHCPLTPATRHLIGDTELGQMKPGALLINTGRGALLDSHALLEALKRQTLGGLALDVYEEEEGVFFHDLSEAVLQDDTLSRLLTFPHVLVTGHQGFLTAEALHNIAETTLINITCWADTGRVEADNVVRLSAAASR